MQHGRAHVLQHPHGINIIAQSLAGENSKAKVAGRVAYGTISIMQSRIDIAGIPCNHNLE